MKYTKYMAAGAVSMASLFFVSCGGDEVTVVEGATAAEIEAAVSTAVDSAASTTVEGADLAIEAPEEALLNGSDLSLVVEAVVSGSNASFTNGESIEVADEIWIDFASSAFAEVYEQNNDTLSGRSDSGLSKIFYAANGEEANLSYRFGASANGYTVFDEEIELVLTITHSDDNTLFGEFVSDSFVVSDEFDVLADSTQALQLDPQANTTSDGEEAFTPVTTGAKLVADTGSEFALTANLVVVQVDSVTYVIDNSETTVITAGIVDVSGIDTSNPADEVIVDTTGSIYANSPAGAIDGTWRPISIFGSTVEGAVSGSFRWDFPTSSTTGSF